MDYLQKQVNHLKAQVQHLEEISEQYKQQFIVWQYNAYMHGMTEDLWIGEYWQYRHVFLPIFQKDGLKPCTIRS